MKIGIFCTTSENFISKELFEILNKNKKFKVHFAIFSKKSDKKKIKNFRLNKKIKIFIENRPDKNKQIMNYCKNEKIDLMICIGFEFIIREKFIKIFRKGIINIHPSYLPFNRGCHHSFWSIIKNKPFGCSLHYMDSGIDTGQIISRSKFNGHDNITAREAIHLNFKKIKILFKKNLNKIYSGKVKLIKQRKGSYHSQSDILKKTVFKTTSEKNISVKYLWKLIRATNYKNNGIFFDDTKNKIKYKIVFKISKEDI